MNLLEFEQLMTGANMPRCLQRGALFDYGESPSFWAFVLDIYDNILLKILTLYLLATILWMIFNISWSINLIASENYKHNLKLNFFKADKMGGIRPLKNLVSSLSVYYFISIVLFIMTWSYPTPRGPNVLPYESTLLIIIWLIGVAFFIWSWYTIRKLLIEKFEEEVNHISDLCQNKTQQLSDVVSKDDPSEIEKHLNQISIALDVLYKERGRMLELGARPMDFKTLFLFLGSSLSSLISIIETLTSEKDVQIIGLVIPYINQLLGYFNHNIVNVF